MVSLRVRLLCSALLATGTLACATEPSGAQVISTERVPTTLREHGAVVHLEMVFHKPIGPGPFPTVVFNHGSTGSGDDPRLFTQTWSSPSFSRVLNAMGWMVVFPQRRGRGKSDGVYDEGFEPDHSRYSCSPQYSLPGVDRAMEDIDAAVAHLRSRRDVIPGRMLIAGQSRGGILAIAHAGTRPGVFLGAINFVGGWMTDRCPDPAAINTVTFQRGAGSTRPTLWLYGEADPFYGMPHSRQNFAAFQAAGGVGTFSAFQLPAGVSGHSLLGYPALWQDAVATFVQSIPVPSR